MTHRTRHRLTATASSITVAFALILPLAGSAAFASPFAAVRPVAGGPEAAAPATASALPESGKLPYYEDKLMKELLMIRLAMEKGQPGRAFSEWSNVAFALVDPTGLSEEQLDAIVGNPPQGSGPLVVHRKVDLFEFRDYLPEGAYQRVRKAGHGHLLLVGGMSFPRSRNSDEVTDPGSHSEALVLRALKRLADNPVHAGASFGELTWASERDYCQQCRRLVDGGARRFHTHDYDLTDAEVAERDRKIAAAMKKHTTAQAQDRAVRTIRATYRQTASKRNEETRLQLGKDIARARQRYGEEQYQEATEDTMKVPGAPCPDTTVDNASAQRSSSVTRANPAVFARPGGLRFQPCDEDGGASAPRTSGLAKALADPASAPGGIDFTTLELRYLSDSGKGLRYAFSAGPGGPGNAKNPAAGVKAAKESSDAFFVWLSMPRSTFWVNLNPTEPDRIVDAGLGRTDVGRILLQADLQLKKTTAALIHPKTESGKKFWNRIGGRCMSFRTWIVPGQARVNEQDDQLYILDAPLKVRMESQHLSGEGSEGAASCKDSGDPGAEKRNEKTFRDLILPGIERAVNHASQYADLRRVYLSRVAAEWYRERAALGTATYGDLVDRGDVSRWETRTRWKPRDTFDAYVHSYKHGEFKITERTRKGDYIHTRTYIYGGIDLSRLQLRKVASAEAFRDRWEDMPQDTARSAQAVRPAANGSQVWMGGDNSTTDESSSGDEGGKDDQGKGGGDEGRSSARSAGDSSGVPGGRLVLPLAGAGLLLVVVLLRRRTGRARAGSGPNR
ncbi:hypothetical protein C5F59_001355 [Streptomyces sp. QL37]|uniref:hypothetical protein n=1 Tax=Streptomyces sp. QL37 TaxID=2093747 RepID=UPI000CF23AEE|nr:hypothetical protein [Streptomyces sp. QL37]PPQ55490.1 hypothetical protein C5F59_01345 [Streptomyces sp. QL37]